MADRVWLPWAGLVVLAFAFLTITHAEADLWGHVRFGLDMLDTRHLTSVDPYSFTQDRPWLNHEWLSELIMAGAYRLAGPAGLAVLKASLVFTVFWLVWANLRQAHHVIRLAAMAWLMLGAVHMVSSVRPQLWSFLAMALLCRTLAERHGRPPFWLPLVLAGWANLHGGWIVGLGVLFAWTFASSVADRSVSLRGLLTVAACLLATLCTPYGWRLWEFISQTVRVERPIAEWRPIWEAGGPAAWVAWAGTSAAVFWFGWRRQPDRWARLAVLAILAIASLRVMRIGSLYVTAALVLLAPALAAAWPAPQKRTGPTRSKWAVLVVAMPSLVALVAAARVGVSSLSCVRSDGPRAPDAAAVELLRSAGPGRLVTYFDWGEYAIWHLGPSIRVSIDGRRETVYSEAHLVLHDGVVQGTAEGLTALAAWRPDYVWLPLSSASTRSWLVRNGYRVVLETPQSFVAARNLVPWAGRGAGPSGERRTERCFPD